MAAKQEVKKAGESENVNRWLVILGIIYILTLWGINSDKYRHYFLPRISLLFLISVIPLYIFHKGSFSKLIGFSIITFLVVMLTEILSLQSLHFFGIISYGNSLGWKIAGVPVIKGVLWFGLIYCSCMIVNILKTRVFYKALLIGFLMAGIDVIIEKVATVKSLNFWSFGNFGPRMQVPIPLTQYLVWLILSFGLGYYFVTVFGKTKNTFVKFYLMYTILFFLSFYFIWGI